MPRKRWIKLWTQETLYGTTSRELTPAERAVWYGFLALAGDSIEPGKIQAAPGIPWTNEQMATILNVPLETLLSAKEKMIRFGKITVNENIIHITNWEKYQGEYEKLREWRERKREIRDEKENESLTNNFQMKGKMKRHNRKRGEQKEKENRTEVVVVNNKATTATLDLRVKEVTRLYENTISLVNRYMAEVIKDACSQYPIDWFRYAFGQASEHNKRNWAYVEKILFRLEEEYGGVPEEDEYGKIG